MEWMQYVGLGGGAVALSQLAWAIWKDYKGGGIRKGNAEAAKASLDAAQAEASIPYVQESLRLGNLAEAITIQQQVINGLREHAAWQDGQIVERDARITELEARLADRDRQIDELEARLGTAETSLTEARRIIDHLRQDPDHTPPALK